VGIQSSLTRAVAVLAAEVKLAHRISRGDAYGVIEERLEEVATHLAHRAWETKRSPSSGRPWRPGTSKGRGDLFESGNLFKSVAIEERTNGFAITIRAHASGGQLYGGTHQYGRTIRSKGLKTASYKMIMPAGSMSRQRERGVKNSFGKAATVRTFSGATSIATVKQRGVYHGTETAKRLIGGKWKLRIPARAMLPKGGQLPADWEEAFTREITKWIMRYGGRFYTAGTPDLRG
jgi:hypothetical protein